MESPSVLVKPKSSGPLERRYYFSAERLFYFFASLKLAVVVMSGLTIAMIAATVIESETDTPTAQFWVYRSAWFYLLLFLLGVNIFVTAVSRWPWKKHHTAFLLAHAGILLLLAGSWVTWQYGIDGMMRIQEGQSSSAVELNEPQLFFTDESSVKSRPIPWVPEGATFRPLDIPEYTVRVEEFLTHADPDYKMIPAEAGEKGMPAVKVLVQGGFMRIRQEYWLWAGDPAWSMIQAGPAVFTLTSGQTFSEAGSSAVGMPGVRMDLIWDSKGVGQFRAKSSAGHVVSGPFKQGQTLEPGWKGGVTVTVLEVIPSATARVAYKPSKIQYGDQAPPSAIRITAGEKKEASMWLGLGDRATLTLRDRQVGVAYLPKRVHLPYSLKLDRFEIDFYSGTRSPSSFSSQVTVQDPSHPEKAKKEFPTLISMNEPLHHRDLTFYQSSYEPGEPRPTVSVFSVNRDPGRATKYAGSLLLVAGVIRLFAEKLKKSRGQKKAAAPTQSEAVEMKEFA